MKTILAMLIVGVVTCSFVIAAFTQDSAQDGSGKVLFNQHCAACHPNGGNVINPNKPLKVGQSLKSFETFLPWIRNPVQPMPPFPPSKISDQQAKELYDYILKQDKGAWK